MQKASRQLYQRRTDSEDAFLMIYASWFLPLLPLECARRGRKMALPNRSTGRLAGRGTKPLKKIKSNLWTIFVCLAFVNSAYAGDKELPVDVHEQGPPGPILTVNSEASYVGNSEIKQGNAKLGQINESETDLSLSTMFPVLPNTLLEVGVDWQRFNFGLFNQAPLPNTLQSITIPLALDIQVDDKWSVRLGLNPLLGSTSDSFKIKQDFLLDGLAAAQYQFSDSLSLTFGLAVAQDSQYPVLPIGGVVWTINPQWKMDASFPKPRIDYTVSKDVTVFGGAELLGNTYRSGSSFGSTHGDAQRNHSFNNAPLTYTEVRAGVGANWQANKQINLELSTGALVYREFSFERAKTRFTSDSPAPYVEVHLGISF